MRMRIKSIAGPSSIINIFEHAHNAFTSKHRVLHFSAIHHYSGGGGAVKRAIIATNPSHKEPRLRECDVKNGGCYNHGAADHLLCRNNTTGRL